MRVSKLAKELGDTYSLDQWRKRQVVLGMSKRADLVTLAQTLQEDDKRALNDIAKSAMDAAGSDRKANIGTAIHTLTERVDDGEDIETMPEAYRGDLRAYRDALAQAGIISRAKELFVVNDTVKAAGTFDRLLTFTRPTPVTFLNGTSVMLPAGAVTVGDVKTGAHDPDYPHGVTTQIATYANSHLYDVERGRYGYLPELGVSTTVGVLIHMPQGTGTCRLYALDLTVGWALALTASAVIATFKDKPITPLTP
jgi:hypothetical protein